MQKKLKNGLWGVLNPPAFIKWFKTEELADEYIERLTQKEESSEVEYAWIEKDGFE